MSPEENIINEKNNEKLKNNMIEEEFNENNSEKDADDLFNLAATEDILELYHLGIYGEKENKIEKIADKMKLPLTLEDEYKLLEETIKKCLGLPNSNLLKFLKNLTVEEKIKLKSLINFRIVGDTLKEQAIRKIVKIKIKNNNNNCNNS